MVGGMLFILDWRGKGEWGENNSSRRGQFGRPMKGARELLIN
jgi:hypothetical protein